MDPHQKQTNQQSKYQFCYHADDPYSLTITKQPKAIYDALYKQATYIWIYQGTKQLKYKQQYIQQKSELKINFLKTVQDLKKHYEKKSANIVIICHRSLIKEVENDLEPMIKAFKIRSIVFYGHHIGIKKNIIFFFSWLNIAYVDSEQKAIDQIRDNKKYYGGDFINFISLDQQKWDSNILVKTMFAMIRHKTNVQQIMSLFKKIALYCYEGQFKSDIQQFFNQYSEKDNLEGNKAVWWYAKQSFLYRFVNRILRVSKDPTCLFIIQPYFKDLFINIRKLYCQQQKNDNKNLKKFTVYRGAEITENQIKYFKQNINSFVQNLGFLSTSRDKIQASGFGKNTMFIIQVDESKRNFLLDYGFADISDDNPNEEDQILFNPMNSFKIEDFFYDELKNIYQIKLKYGQMARVSVNKSAQLAQGQLNYKWLGDHQMRESLQCQQMGDVLIGTGYNLEGSQEYCDKFFEIFGDSLNQFGMLYGHSLKGKLAFNKGDYKTMNIQFRKKLQICQRGVKIDGSNNEELHNFILTTANTMSNLGLSLNNLGKYQQGLDYLLLSSKIYRQNFGENNHKYFGSLVNISTLYISMGQNLKAVECLQKCQKIIKLTHEDNYPEKRVILHNFGMSLKGLGNYQKAIEYFEKCQKIIKLTLGEHHPDYTRVLNNLGTCFMDLGEDQMAFKYLQKCLKIQKKSIGENHPSFASTLYNLCGIFIKFGQYQKALQHLQRCQKIQIENFGQNNPIFVQNLGIMFEKLGKYQKAVKYFEQYQRIQKETLTQNHPDYAVTLDKLASSYHKLGQYQKAAELYEKYEKIQNSALEINYQIYASTIENLCLSFTKLNKDQKIIQYLLRFLKIQREMIGENQGDYAATLNNLGASFDKKGQNQIATQYYQKCIEIMRVIGENNNLDYAKILSNLGSSLNKIGQYQKAVESYQQCQKIQRQILGQISIDYAHTLSNLSSLYSKLGNVQKSQYYSHKFGYVKQKLYELSELIAKIIQEQPFNMQFYNQMLLYIKSVDVDTQPVTPRSKKRRN